MKKLMAGRTDIYVDLDIDLVEILRSPEFIQSDIHIAGVVEEVVAHSYLHKRYASLAPKLSAILKDMKQDGLIEKYRIMAETFVTGKYSK